jgi:hypothetical protein
MTRRCEVILDEDGTVLARVQVRGDLSPEARVALAALIKAVSEHHLKADQEDQA